MPDPRILPLQLQVLLPQLGLLIKHGRTEPPADPPEHPLLPLLHGLEQQQTRDGDEHPGLSALDLLLEKPMFLPHGLNDGTESYELLGFIIREEEIFAKAPGALPIGEAIDQVLVVLELGVQDLEVVGVAAEEGPEGEEGGPDGGGEGEDGAGLMAGYFVTYLLGPCKYLHRGKIRPALPTSISHGVYQAELIQKLLSQLGILLIPRLDKKFAFLSLLLFESC